MQRSPAHFLESDKDTLVAKPLQDIQDMNLQTVRQAILIAWYVVPVVSPPRMERVLRIGPSASAGWRGA